MCGINGIFGTEHLQDAVRRVEKMNDRTAHRGPDAAGVYEGANCVLGHRRLSIIDLEDRSNQPFHSADGRFVVAFNGEIYNYASLKGQLAGQYPFTTGSDTEVLMAAWSAWGSDCLSRLNGMFAFAVWDAQNESLFLCRDRLGIKPLYYIETGTSLIFSSEIRGVLASGLVRAEVNEVSLVDYLRYQCVHAPETMLKGVKLLQSGHFMEISDGLPSVRRYWDPINAEVFNGPEKEAKSKIRQLFTQSVEDRLMADVPFGAFLSGGIDSSLVVAVMSQVMDRKVSTFHVSFEEESFSEARYARMVAEKYGTDHQEITLKPQDLLDQLPDALSAMDHPSGDGPNTWLVSKKTREAGIKMALSGLGGDELFAGYDVFRRIPEIGEKDWILSFPKFLRSMAGSAYMSIKPGMASAKAREILRADYFDLVHLYPVMRQVLLDGEIQKLVLGPLPANAVKGFLKQLNEQTGFNDMPVLSKISVAEIYTYMQNVLLRDTDQMSMAHALEVRVPFLDHRLVEFALSVPDYMKYPTRPKKLLVDAFNDLLPMDLVNRPKMGFVFPWEVWLRDSLRAYAGEKMHALAARAIFREKAVIGLWERFLANDPRVSWSRVWPLIVLEDWLQGNEVG